MLDAWRRRAILAVLAFEAVSAIPCGLAFVVYPDGRALDMPTSMLRSVFADFLVPGLLLTALGVLNAWAFFELYARSPKAWLAAGLATGGMVVWFLVQIAVLQGVHWAQAVWGIPPLVAGLLALPLVPRRREKRAGPAARSG